MADRVGPRPYPSTRQHSSLVHVPARAASSTAPATAFARSFRPPDGWSTVCRPPRPTRRPKANPDWFLLAQLQRLFPEVVVLSADEPPEWDDAIGIP
jgi:hypothetical protein